MDDLTNEQKHLLVSMYKEVLSRQPALSMEASNYFSDSNEVRDLFLPDLSESYVADLCFALSRKGYIICHPGDDLANDIKLADSTIVYMEGRFLRNLKAVLKYLSYINKIF